MSKEDILQQVAFQAQNAAIEIGEAFDRFVDQLYEVRSEPDKLLIMITNQHYVCHRLHRIKEDQEAENNMRGWIGVDLDGTLSEWHRGDSVNQIGAPVAKMVSRVRDEIKAGMDIRIFTARVADTGDSSFITRQKIMIQKWCRDNLGYVIPITAQKDFHCIEIWDDRAKHVIANEGTFGEEP